MNTTKIRKLVSRAERSIAKNRKGAAQKQNRAEERGKTKEQRKEQSRSTKLTQQMETVQWQQLLGDFEAAATVAPEAACLVG